MNYQPQLEFPVDAAPAPGTRINLIEGIDWVYQPLPFRLNHVNCWWLDGGDGHCVQVDTGIASDTTRKHWKTALQGATPDSLLITHFHPDHSGLAGEYARAGVAMLSSKIEMTLSARIYHTADVDFGHLYAQWYQQNGLDDEAVATAHALGNVYRRIMSESASLDAYTWLEHGQHAELGGRSWRVMHGAGHAPAMIMLFDEAEHVLIAADQVLPGITPNVSVGVGTVEDPAPFGLREADPLQRFIETLDALKALPTDTLVLPSHGLPFRGLHARLDDLTQHHETRLARVLEACVEPKSAAELFTVLFGKKMDAQQMSFALGESLAHAEHLVMRGDVHSEVVAGVRRYACG